MSNGCKVQGLAKTNTAYYVTDNKLGSSELLYQQKCDMYPYLDHNDPRLRLTDEHIIDMDIDLSKSIMSEGDKLKLHDILIQEKQSLSLHGEVRNCPDFEVDTPFYIRPYKVSEQYKEKIDEYLAKLVKMNVLKKGLTDYSSPIMLLNKKNSKEKRQVVDFRFLNSKIRKKEYQFPID